MFRHLGWLVGLNYKSSSKRLPDAKPALALAPTPVAMLDAVQEIAIYIHRFHNLDLFQQGWYQIKITMRWEDTDFTGTPARVVQYEAPDVCSDDVYGVWRIDDTDNSFSTQPFRIKYARQDVFLSIMIAFNLSIYGNEGQSSSAVLLKFQLMHAPISGDRSDLQEALDANPAAVHEFRIPPKALTGLHSYCPVHFDAFHSVLVDVSLHISLLKAPYKHPSKVSSFCSITEGVGGESPGSIQAAPDWNGIMLLKSLFAARSILLEELQTLSKAIDQEIDLTDFISKMDNMNDSFLQEKFVEADDKVSGQGKPQNGLEKATSRTSSRSSQLPRSFSRGDILNSFNSLGDQVIYLWNMFLQFHRFNKTKILEYLHDTWARDRRAEWSIWMVYSKVEMPHHFLNSGFDESSNSGGHRRTPTFLKLNDDPAQIAANRSELHRRSIAQMKINNSSIQDLHIFGDPSSIPIVIVERVMNAPRRTTSENSYLRHLDVLNASGFQSGSGSESLNNQYGNSSKKGRALKIVVFVHGFQGHHLDLRLIRNQWLLVDPKAEFLMSEANEDKTSSDFREMGQRLAQEVVNFLKKKMDKASRSGIIADIKLSFVGHSIGNVIIRTALTDAQMEPFLKYLYAYVSISGPHLGYLYSSNSLFNSGLWLLKKFKNTQCIHQLTFTDDPDLQNTFIYQLCKKKTLENFKHIILLSSPQDGYVPYHSARIDMCQAASLDYSKRGKVFLEMLNDCLDQIRAPSSVNRVFMRCDINFDTSAYGKNLNTFIGRAAHIDFLESDTFARFIMWSFPDLFRVFGGGVFNSGQGLLHTEDELLEDISHVHYQPRTELILQIVEGDCAGLQSQHCYFRDCPIRHLFASLQDQRWSLPGPSVDGRIVSPTLMWIEALDLILDKLLNSKLNFGKIVAVSGSGQQHGSVYWKNGSSSILSSSDPKKPLAPQFNDVFSVKESPVWMDSSTTAECKELENAVGGALELSKLTGSHAYERFTGPQIKKIFKTHPEAYNNTERISLVSSFLASLLIRGYACINETDGAGMNLMDIKKRTWSEAVLKAIAPGLEEKLGKLAPAHAVAGCIAPYFVERFKFNKSCLVIQFSGDNPNSLAGLTLSTPGDLAMSLGTSDTVFGITDDPHPWLEGHVFPNPVDIKGYMVMLCYKNGSLTREDVRNRHAWQDWDNFGNNLTHTTTKWMGFYYTEHEILPPLPAGHHWYVLEIFTGDTLEGVTVREEKKEFGGSLECRAVLEGQFLSMQGHAERFGMASPPKRIIATGGGSVNRPILGIAASIFGCEIYTVERPDSASLGAALRAAHGWLCSKKGSFVPFSCVYGDKIQKTSLKARLAAIPELPLIPKYGLMMKKRLEIEDSLAQKLGRM